jgi:hypothetical protein
MHNVCALVACSGSAPTSAKRAPGTLVTFSNLNHDVTVDDIEEVAATAGVVGHNIIFAALCNISSIKQRLMHHAVYAVFGTHCIPYATLALMRCR